MYARNSHSYTHLIPDLGIVREPRVWGFITSKYPGIHDIGLPNTKVLHEAANSIAPRAGDIWMRTVSEACFAASIPHVSTSYVTTSNSSSVLVIQYLFRAGRGASRF